MIRGIVFDLFDTLVDQNPDRLAVVEVEGKRVSPSAPDLHRCLTEGGGVSFSIQEFVALQRDVDKELFRETIKRGIELPTDRRFEVLLERLGIGGDPDLAKVLTATHMAVLRKAVSVPEHHESVLVSLAIDHQLGLCSNFSDAKTAYAILDDAAFTPHLKTTVISEEHGIRKPRGEIFEAVLEALNLEAREILHVGDSLRADVAGAAALGMKTVWVTRQIENPEEQLADYLAAEVGPRPDFAIEDLLDLPVLAARLSR